MRTHVTEPKICSKRQLIQLQSEAGLALEEIWSSTANRILGNKRNFRQLMKDLVRERFGLPPNILEQVVLIEAFFQNVFDLKISGLSSMEFPEKNGFDTFMVVPDDLTEDQILLVYKQKWDIVTETWATQVHLNTDGSKSQSRPEGLYLFGHRDGDTPDKQLLGKSYDNCGAGRDFMDTREYLLASGFHKFIKGEFMDFNDKFAWTTTSSVWGDGYVVSACADEEDGAGKGIRLGHIPSNYRDRDRGPREIIIAN